MFVSARISSLSLNSLSVIAIMIGDCFPIPVGAYVPAFKIEFNSILNYIYILGITVMGGVEV